MVSAIAIIELLHTSIMPVSPSFTGLASIISENAQVIEKFLSSSDDIPQPSLGADSSHFFPAPPQATEVNAAREELLDAVRLLQMLALGPVEGLLRIGFHVCGSPIF